MLYIYYMYEAIYSIHNHSGYAENGLYCSAFLKMSYSDILYDILTLCIAYMKSTLYGVPYIHYCYGSLIVTALLTCFEEPIFNWFNNTFDLFGFQLGLNTFNFNRFKNTSDSFLFYFTCNLYVLI
jgi:hypothetical protein